MVGGASAEARCGFGLSIVALVAAVTFHEFAHAFVALRLGDATAKLLGRVSLNPIRHLDLFGSLAFLFFGFGWGKPVPINPYNMRGVSPLVGAAISAHCRPDLERPAGVPRHGPVPPRHRRPAGSIRTAAASSTR